MTDSETPLLNIITLQQLLQLQGKIPGFLTNQLLLLREKWPDYETKLDVALDKQDFQAAADIYHKIKGHAGMLGFHAVQEVAGHFEGRLRDQNPTDTIPLENAKFVLLFHSSLKAAETWLAQNAAAE